MKTTFPDINKYWVSQGLQAVRSPSYDINPSTLTSSSQNVVGSHQIWKTFFAVRTVMMMMPHSLTQLVFCALTTLLKHNIPSMRPSYTPTTLPCPARFSQTTSGCSNAISWSYHTSNTWLTHMCVMVLVAQEWGLWQSCLKNLIAQNPIHCQHSYFMDFGPKPIKTIHILADIYHLVVGRTVWRAFFFLGRRQQCNNQDFFSHLDTKIKPFI